MPKDGVDRLVNKWLNEPGFQGKMRKDPEGTVKSCGITLSADEWATVRNVVMSTSDDQLRERISKAPMN